MISKVKVVVVVSLFFCAPLILVSHAQQAQTETQAVQVMGFAGLKENTKGRLTVVNGTLRFTHAKGTADVSAASIEDVVTGKDNQRIIGGTFGRVALLAAPFGSGRALSLFRKKLDTMTIQYRDADGGLHGAIFTMPVANAEMIKKELIAQGAHTAIAMQAESNETTSRTKEHKQ
jgi:hypothetical protein